MMVKDSLSQIEKNTAYQILSQIATASIEVHFKVKNQLAVHKTRLQRNSVRRLFTLENKNLSLEVGQEVTFKLIQDQHLYFLTTNIKKGTAQFYFDQFEHMYELVRRRKLRFIVPDHWSQTARLQAVTAPVHVKSQAKVIDISKVGLRLLVTTDLPQYEPQQMVNLYLKIYRRSEVLVRSRVIHVKPKAQGGAIVGLEFSDNSILIANKIQNICDDLAFYYTSKGQ